MSKNSEEALHDFLDHVRTENILNFYNEYYQRAQNSRAHSEFCKLVYGHDFCQHGMLDMNQLDRLIEMTGIQKNSCVLELGCGAGLIAEYISDKTGCQMMGIDISSVAIEQASERTKKKDRIFFATTNMESLDYPEGSFDAVISIDTLYYVKDLENTVERILKALKHDGTMYAFYHVHPDVSAFCDPVNGSPLGSALNRLHVAYRVIDFTDENKRHWELRRRALLELRTKFEQEGNMFLYNTRMDEYRQNFGEYFRFLYIAERGADGGTCLGNKNLRMASCQGDGCHEA